MNPTVGDLNQKTQKIFGTRLQKPCIISPILQKCLSKSREVLMIRLNIISSALMFNRLTVHSVNKLSVFTRELSLFSELRRGCLESSILSSRNYSHFKGQNRHLTNFCLQRFWSSSKNNIVVENTEGERRAQNSSPMSFEEFKQKEMEPFEEYCQSPGVKMVCGDDHAKLAAGYEGYCRSRYSLYKSILYVGHPGLMI